MAIIKQWTHDYRNRRKAHIVTPDERTYLIAVYPADPNWIGSLNVDAAASLDDAIAAADRVAEESSDRQDWHSN